MKKVFPIIIILVSLSLIGTIYLQYNWLQTMLQDKQQEMRHDVVRAMADLGNELMEQKSNFPSLKNFRSKPGLNWPSQQFLEELMRPSTIAQRFSALEVQEKLKKAFEAYGLKDLKFEFAIRSNYNLDSYEIQSRNFLTEAEDTVNNFTQHYLFQPASGSDLENLVPMEVLTVVVPDLKAAVIHRIRWMIIGSIVFTLIIISAFFVTVYALIRQKKLSAIKNDFINNMTHEFKTPLATISLAVDALHNEKVLQDRTKMGYFSGIIKEENKRMNKHVETILQAALMDRQEIQLSRHPLHVHELIEEILDHYTLQLHEKNGHAELNLNAANDYIEADPVHFKNILSNLIDNAVKYSNDNLEIRITTHSTSKVLVIRLEDNGIGMSKETLKRIFEKFYRAHTGNLHNVKGFGLGLSYVKTIIDAHQGKVKVDSALGRGSCFTLEIPLLKEA